MSKLVLFMFLFFVKLREGPQSRLPYPFPVLLTARAHQASTKHRMISHEAHHRSSVARLLGSLLNLSTPKVGLLKKHRLGPCQGAYPVNARNEV